MPGEPSSKRQPEKRRGWFRRIGRWIFFLLLVVVVLHRPLVHFAARRAAIWFAKREHMVLDLHVGGNLWSRLELRDVSVRADDSGRAPLERLSVDRLAIEYDIWKAIRADWRRVLRLVEIGTVDGVARLVEPDPNKPVKPPTPVSEVMEKLLSNSLSPLEQLKIGRVDFEVKDVAAVRGLAAAVGNRQPGYIAWEKIHIIGFPDIASERTELVTSESAIMIGKLSLLPQLVIRRLTLNRVTSTLPRGGLEVIVETGGGTATLRVEPSLTKGALDVLLDVNAVRVNEVTNAFQLELPAPILIESFRAKATGAPENIEKSAAGVSFVIRLEERAPAPAVTLRGDAKWERDVFRVSELTAVAQGVDVSIGGEVVVPLKDFHPSRFSGEITWKLAVAVPALQSIVPAQPARGTVAGSGKLLLERGEALLNGDIEGTKLAHGAVQIDSAKIHLDARRKIESFSDILATAGAGLTVDVRGVSAAGIRVDEVAMKATLDGQKVSIEQLSVTAGENRFSSTGRATLTPDATGLAGSPEVDLNLTAPRIEQFGIVVNGAALSGAVSAEGRLRLEGTQPVGNLQFSGVGLLLGEARLGSLRGRVKFENGEATLESANVDLEQAGAIAMKGRVGLNAPMPYSGELNVNLTNLAKLDAVLAAAGHPAKLGGTLTLDWAGDGKLGDVSHNGRMTVKGRELRHDAVAINEVGIGAAYTPRQFETNELLVTADNARLAGRVLWRQARLELSDLTVALSGAEVVKGRASAPFNPANPAGVLPRDQPLSAQFEGKNVDIQRLLSSFGLSSPVSGRVSGNLAVSGSASRPDVKLTVEARELKSPKIASLAPAEVDVKLGLAESRLTVAAVVRQRDIQPLTLNASLPLDVEKLVGKPALLRELPLDVRLKLPASSLNVVPRLAPAVARIDGTLSANVAVSGTVARPIVNGDTVLTAKAVRLASVQIPPLSNFSSKLVFSGDTVTVNDTRGEIGGGSFRVDGNVKLPSLEQPVFDLRLKSDKVLVLRDEGITVRADADVSLSGPLAAASVAGTIFVTQSRFFKDVDILPLSLPGKPKPRTRSVPAPTKISFPNPPLRDWKFDLAIKTRENDPFLIRGNLAKGAAAINVRLAGTGLNPYLAGQVQVENFTAILPTSKLEVKSGTVSFFEDEPFEPRLEIRAESRIRQNIISLDISGPATAPRMDLESQPPLAQKDILSLLTTGTTTGEIGSNASTLATKAALIKVKQWYRKTFRRGAGEEPANGEESLLDRFEMDVGNVDAKTGRPEMTGSFRVNDQLYLLGEIDMQGQPVGRVKYLLRFR